MYLKRSDFETYGFTDGCPGCRDIVIGRPGPSSGWAAHTRACRRRLEEAIQVAEPERWERHLRRRGDGDAGEAAPSAPAAEAALPAPEVAEDEDDDARSSHGDPEEGGEEDLFGYSGAPARESASALRSSTALGAEAGDRKQGEVDQTTGRATVPVGRGSDPS